MTTRWFHWLRSLAVALAAMLLFASTASAAMTVHLWIKANGQPVLGESTQASLGRENSIECVQFEQDLSRPENAGGKAQFGPITCVKRVDKATPLLIRALIKGEAVSGTFKFFRPSPTGDGTTEQFYTIELADAHITGYRLTVPDVLTAETVPPLEEVTFTYRSATWTYTSTGVSFTTTLGGEAESERKVEESQGYNLKAEADDHGAVILRWSQPEGAGHQKVTYDVYRSTDAAVMTTDRNRILDVPIAETTTHDRVFSGTYYYVVQAILADGTKLPPSPAVMVRVE